MTIDRPSAALIPSLRRLWREAFGDTETFLDDFFALAYSSDRARCAVENGEAVGALYWFDAEVEGQRLAYLYAIATAADRRGQGICRRLMEDTHTHLSALGYAGAILVPSEPSLFDFYARFGYAPCAPMHVMTCEAASEAVTLHRVSAEEYGALRDAHLPRGGVRQEGVSLRFLACQAELYAGDGFVLAARKEADALVAAELLGEPRKLPALAPAILRALGCRTGRFRIGGGDAFAMIRPLTDVPVKKPSYFALAFD